MRSLQEEQAAAALEAAIHAVYGWLGENVAFYGALHSDRSDPEMYLGFVRDGIGATDPDAVQEAIRQRQHLLLFIGRRSGEIIIAGFAQFGGKNSALHTVGVHDNYHHTGVTTAMLAWMLGALPASYSPGILRFGTYLDNPAMIAFGHKFGAGEGHQQRWGKEGEDAAQMNAALYDIPVAQACQVLGIEGPSGDDFHFATEPVRDMTFECLYFGRHPQRLGSDESVIINSL